MKRSISLMVALGFCICVCSNSAMLVWAEPPCDENKAIQSFCQFVPPGWKATSQVGGCNQVVSPPQAQDQVKGLMAACKTAEYIEKKSEPWGCTGAGVKKSACVVETDTEGSQLKKVCAVFHKCFWNEEANEGAGACQEFIGWDGTVTWPIESQKEPYYKTVTNCVLPPE